MGQRYCTPDLTCTMCGGIFERASNIIPLYALQDKKEFNLILNCVRPLLVPKEWLQLPDRQTG